MIQLLLDQGLPRSAAHTLRNLGWNVQHVGECGLAGATDAAILDHARKERRVVCTLDADFHALMALSGETSPSVIRIRREGLRGPEIAKLLQAIWARVDKAISRGAVVSVTESAIRIRYLPIGTMK